MRASPRRVSPQLPLKLAGTSAERSTLPIFFGAPPDDQMSITASEGELSLSGDDNPAALPPSGVVALSKPDPEMMAMISRAAENVGLMWNPPPGPDPSRLDEWFLSWGRADSQSQSLGQLGKEQTRANAEELFSRYGVGFGQPDNTPHAGMCSVSAELPQDFIRQDSGPTETFSETPGVYGYICGNISARSAPYETASALAPWLSPEVGVELEIRCSPGSDYTGLPQNLQPVDRSLVPLGRSACGIYGATHNRHALSGVWTGPPLWVSHRHGRWLVVPR